MGAKDNKYNNEEVSFSMPVDIQCKTCENVPKNKSVIPNYNKLSCEKFEVKPSEVLFKGAKCPKYLPKG